MSWDFKLSKKNKRTLSPFIAKELLYDFLNGNLDSDMRSQVEAVVKFDRDLQRDLDHLKKSQDYVKSLANIKINPDLIDELIEQSGIVSELSQRVAFERWPQSLKWGLEAFVVIAVIVSLLTVLPLEQVSEFIQQRNPQVILAEIEMKKDPANLAGAEEPAQFVDEGVAAATATSSIPTVPDKDSKTIVAAAKPVVPTERALAPIAQPSPPVPPIIEKTPDSRPTQTTTRTEEAKPSATTGVLYRGALAVTNVEVIGPKITEKITNLGGRKAGSVELGWKKGANSIYYHFTIPEAKYEDLVSFLGTYGNPKIQKEKHPRVMPDGIIRLIISVEEAAK